MKRENDLPRLLREIARCELCKEHLPLGPRPVLAAHRDARILVVGQAPGRRVHETGIPWNDPSGDRLRDWLGVDRERFYDARTFGIVPMGFCFPGTGTSGDLPPRPECAPEWHEALLACMPRIELTILLSRYALDRYLAGRAKENVTETVRAWREYGPELCPLPHPSPRNNRWLTRNPWFAEEVLPALKRRVRRILRARSAQTRTAPSATVRRDARRRRKHA